MELSDTVLDLDTLPVIGIGPMASVRTLRPSASADLVAVKVFPEPMDRFTRAAFDRERSAIAGLSGVSSILRIDAVVAGVDGRPGLCMELCEQSLWELVQAHGPLSLPDTLAIGQAVVTALIAAAEVGVGHGGVTPHNVLLRADGEPVLADFGSALRRRYAGGTAFAPPWAAPETVRDNELTMAADLYGLGAVLYLALTGHPPFVDPAATPDHPDLPGPVRELLAGLLTREPAERMTDPDAVLARLVGLIEFNTEPAPSSAEAVAVVNGVGDFPASQQSYELTAERFFAEWQDTNSPDNAAAPDPEPIPPPPAAGPDRSALGRVCGAAAMLAVLVAVPIIVGGQPAMPAPANPPVSTVSAPSSANRPQTVGLKLDPPVDRGNEVDLTWHGDTALHYAVVVAGAEVPTKVIFVNGKSTQLRIPVDPARQYCFLVQGTDGSQVVQTAPIAIRDAVCHQ
jgi:hypothetical protein